jgi:hypothetical protein
MKQHSAIGWQGTRTVVLIITGVLFTPVYCQVPSVALLIQQSPSQGGTITPGPGVHDFAINSEVTLTAIPKAGYHFVCWLGDVSDPTSDTTITFLNKPKIIIAVFEQNEYETLSEEANASGGARGGPAAGGHRLQPLNNLPQEYIPGSPPEPPVPPGPPIPEPATALLLALGSVALLRERSA